MTVAIGFVFKDFFKPRIDYSADPVSYYQKSSMSNLKFAIIVTAPAVILHEFGHKFIAMAFGMNATFHAAYTWLLIAVILKLFNSRFLFIVPAYVSWSCTNTLCLARINSLPIIPGLIAFAGPGINLLIWLSSWYVYKNFKLKTNIHQILVLTSKINMFLFIFNMLPIPGFDGFHIFSTIFNLIL